MNGDDDDNAAFDKSLIWLTFSVNRDKLTSGLNGELKPTYILLESF